MNAITVNHLSKYFNGFCAVDDISFEVESGEIFGFLGPNGAGKTTTIRMLTTILLPSSGKITIFDLQRGPDDLAIKQLMGIVPEMANVYNDLTALQNLQLMGELYDVPKKLRNTRAEELLTQFDMYDMKNVRAKQFSKGLRQRLLLCMALIHSPKILFLDEPTSGLDVQSSRIIKNLIKDYNKQGTTVFLTTHNMDVANELCDRIAIINKGKIIELDTPESLKQLITDIQTLEVLFDKAVDPLLLENLVGVSKVVKTEKYYCLYIENPTQVVFELMQLVRDQKLRIKSLSLLSPKLEEVFLKIITEDA
jgi:ABC-2 type transport system ATP-binding protein